MHSLSRQRKKMMRAETVSIDRAFTWIFGMRVQRIGDEAWSINVVCPTYGIEIYGLGKSRSLAIRDALELLEAAVKREERSNESTGPYAQRQGGSNVRKGEAEIAIPFEAPRSIRQPRAPRGNGIFDEQ